MFDPFLIRKHRDRFPRAVLRAKRAADAAFDIHFHHLLKLGVLDSGNDFNAVHGTENNAGFATGTAGLIDDC